MFSIADRNLRIKEMGNTRTRQLTVCYSAGVQTRTSLTKVVRRLFEAS